MTEEVASQEEGIVAPVEDEQQPETQDDVKPEQDEPEGKPEEPKEEKPKLKGVAKRLHQLTQERDYYRFKLEEAQAPKEPEKAPDPVKTLKDFDYDESKFTEYVLNRAAQLAEDSAQRAVKTQAERFQDEQSQARTDRLFRAREAEFAKSVKDYEQVAHYAPISEPVTDIIKAMDEGPEVAYYLGNNHDVAESLNQLPPHVAAVELGRLASELAVEKSKAKASVTKAPAPPPKIEGSEPGMTVDPTDPESDKLSASQWLKAREKQLASR